VVWTGAEIMKIKKQDIQSHITWINTTNSKLHNYRKMLRIGDWIKFYPLFPLLGAYLASGISSPIIIVFVIFFCVISYGFVINNFYDQEIDRKHSKKMMDGTNPLANSIMSKGETLGICIVLAGISLMLSFIISGLGFVFTLLCLTALTLYSAKPVRFKDWFIADIICHGLMFGGLPFFAGYTLAGGDIFEPFSLPAGLAVICTLICCEALIAHEILDYNEDLGVTSTTVTHIGLRNGVFLLGITAFGSIVAFELMALWFAIDLTLNAMVVCLLLIYPLFSYRKVIIPVALKNCRICCLMAEILHIR